MAEQSEHAVLPTVGDMIKEVGLPEDQFSSGVKECERYTVVGERCVGVIAAAASVVALLEESETKQIVVRAVSDECDLWLFG